MKTEFPKGFHHIGQTTCASCAFIEKKQKTKTAYCNKYGITYPLYEACKYYSCEDHIPLRGKWSEDNFVTEPKVVDDAGEQSSPQVTQIIIL